VVLSLLGTGCPGALAFDRSGNLLVTDPCADLIRRVSPAGQTMAVLTSTGLRGPGSLVLDPEGDLFVANTGQGAPFGRSIHRYSSTGQDRGTFVALKTGFPGGLAFDRPGQLLVADQLQRRGQIDYAIRRFSMGGRELGPLAVVPYQPRALLVMQSKQKGKGED
jgi:sugar lactone lactonase YvrE